VCSTNHYFGTSGSDELAQFSEHTVDGKEVLLEMTVVDVAEESLKCLVSR